MSMPTIPKEPHRPNLKQVTIDLLESIALEEIALSHIMNAEAEKIQAFVGKCCDFPTDPDSREIIKFNKGVNQLLKTIVMKEWLLLNKLESVIDFVDEKICFPKKRIHKCKSKCDHDCDCHKKFHRCDCDHDCDCHKKFHACDCDHDCDCHKKFHACDCDHDCDCHKKFHKCDCDHDCDCHKKFHKGNW